MKRQFNYILCLLLCAATSCESFLDERPDKALVVPATLQDLEALLDDHAVIANNYPSMTEVSADNYYLTDADWAGLPEEEYRRAYTWEKDRVFIPSRNDWYFAYRSVYSANTVLETVGKIQRTPAEAARWDNVKGQAMFVRASSFLQAALLWAPVYRENTAATDLGIPLRLDTDFNKPSVRSSVQQSFQRIIKDLKAASPLLPVTPVHVIRPSRPAAYGLLARTYLYMGNYPLAEAYADSSLQLNAMLMNYNSLNATASFPIARYNPEVILHSLFMSLNPSLAISRARIVPELYGSYDANDLRKSVFFRSNGDGSFAFKGSYSNSGLFGGIATDELYLTRAEARARQGKIPEALGDLNTLLATRWKEGTFVPLTTDDQAEALQLILQERRKELVMRGLRWMDLKRLNRDGAGITLTRTVNGQTYTLPPNDPRYALPIPDDVMELSGMQQNPR
ncbi:RagB/SusD family nutrient uptake outer membrane protein [Pontibacter sp. H249]|uniref:RagB/SusD family nutrient uptake outer membrane protein n=1 Tax=Pontibacter sp. H249 TaxID=3133420 RepID=UPI0030BA83C4